MIDPRRPSQFVSMMRFFSFLFVVAAISFRAQSAAAAELIYDAPAECPGRDAALVRIGQSDPQARVTIRRKANGFAADAAFGEGEHQVTRHLEGETCEGVLDALNVVFALDLRTQQAKAVDETSPPAEASAPSTSLPEPSPKTPSTPERHRSAIELAFGGGTGIRSLQSKTMWGLEAYVELAAPELAASWSRPSVRLGAGSWGSGIFFDDMLADPTSTGFDGGSLDLCPIGAALVSTQRVDLILSGCGVFHVGSADRNGSSLWVDGGGVGRAVVQIGSKRHFRGFISADGGLLWRLGNPVMDPPAPATSEDSRYVVVYGAPNGAMFTVALSGGLLFP